jgi:PAS domain S-box-containing protein
MKEGTTSRGSESNIEFRLFEATPGISALIEPGGLHAIVAATDNFLQIAGLKKEDVIGKGFFECLPRNPQDQHFSGESNLRASFQFVRNYRQVHTIALQRYDVPNNPDAFSERYWSITNKPFFNEKGEVEWILFHSDDITDRVKTDTPVHAMGAGDFETSYDLFMKAPLAVCIVRGPNYVVELANDNMLQFLGRTPEMLGKPIITSLPEAELQGLIGILDRVRETSETRYLSTFPAVILINGKRELRYFDLIFKPLSDNSGDEQGLRIVCVAHNVTEQVLARDKIKESEEELQLALQVAELGTFKIDLQQNTAFYADRVKEWFGFSGQGIHVEDILNAIDPEDRERVRLAIRLTRQSEEFSRHDIVYRITRKGTTCHYRSFGKTLFNSEGTAYLIIGTIQDITPQAQYQEKILQSEEELQRRVHERTAELETLNMELKRSNANLEEFAYAASHDMKEPIRKILYFSDRLKQELGDQLNTAQRRHFDRMEGAARRMGTLIDDLLMYSHISRGANLEEQIDLNKKIRMVLEDLELEIQEKQAHLHIGTLPVVKGHRRQLQQLFQNLIGNALKYGKPGEPVHISIEAKQVWGHLLPDFQGRQEQKKYHLIDVSDKGIGFEQEEADRIFNVFTRLHGNSEFKGTGVGLSIARKVTENHGGTIWAEGLPDKGATFHVVLPAE